MVWEAWAVVWVWGTKIGCLKETASSAIRLRQLTDDG